MVKLELDEKRTHEVMYGYLKKRKKLECVIAGRGDPHLVLLSGYGVDMDASWAKLFPHLREICRTIAYNRWGVGKSSSTTVPQTGLEVITALRSLLSIEEVHAPYILVGHSIGGVYAQLFARLYPNEVAGMVLVDSSHPDQFQMKKELDEGLARRALDGTLDFIDYTVAPKRHSEITSFKVTAQQVREAPDFPNIPLVVITAGIQPPALFMGKKFREVWQENQQKLVALSPQGRQVIAENSRHFVQNDEPELVLQAIRDVIDAIRSNPLRPVPTPRSIRKMPI